MISTKVCAGYIVCIIQHGRGNLYDVMNMIVLYCMTWNNQRAWPRYGVVIQLFVWFVCGVPYGCEGGPGSGEVFIAELVWYDVDQQSDDERETKTVLEPKLVKSLKADTVARFYYVLGIMCLLYCVYYHVFIVMCLLSCAYYHVLIIMCLLSCVFIVVFIIVCLLSHVFYHVCWWWWWSCQLGDERTQAQQVTVCVDLAKRADRVVMLSGTPSLSKPFDLFNQASAADAVDRLALKACMLFMLFMLFYCWYYLRFSICVVRGFYFENKR